VTFSGDKLLGGPQAGFIAGRRDLIRRIARHPLKRALRLDKIRLAAIEATLKLYADPDRLRRALPTIALLVRPAEDIEAAARRLHAALAAPLAERALRLDVEACRSQIGSGALPLDLMPSWALTLRLERQRPADAVTLEKLAARLRGFDVPVIGRLEDGRLWLDLRCLSPEDEALLAGQLQTLRI
jgi:L-seryl-tRNA(Ser) seleniumtransferase